MKKTGKRLLSLVLCLTMVITLLPTALIPTVQAAGESSSSSTNEFGFSTDVPDDFHADDGKHPFGSQGSTDRVNLMPVKEIGVMETDGSSNYTKILDNMSTTLFSSSPSTDKFLYVNGVAYDPTGSGRDDHVFYYGPVQGNTNIVSMQDYSYENGKAGTVYTRNLSAGAGNEYAYSWMTEARPYNAEGYLPIAAGDFNGDGKETVVLLDPEYTKLCLREYTIKEGYGLDYLSSYDIGNNVSYSKGTLNTIQNFDSGSDKNKKARNTPSIQLAAGDLDGDGADELVVTVSLGDMYKEGGTWNRGSKVLVFEKSDTGWTQKSSTQFDSVGGKVLRAAASVVGDIDGDGNNEIVTVGVGSNDHEDNDDYEFGDYYCILMTYSNGSLSQRGSCTLTRTTTSREKDTVEYMAPLSVGLVHFNGVGTTPYLFVRGEVYQYNSGIYERFGGDTSMMGSQKIVRQPIIGNFDGNNRGQEQVLFVMATGT
ncbi:MAG: FG-GAP repeat domain-containing protein, partial [Oscillospiraceae bacterium]